MSPQGKKRSRLSAPEDIQALVEESTHAAQSSKTAPQDHDNLLTPGSADVGSEDTRAEVAPKSPPAVPSPAQASSPRKYDDDGLLIFRPPPPITNWRFGVREPSPPPELTEEEREIEELWEEMDYALQYQDGSPEKASSDISYHSGEETDEESEP